MTSKGLNRGGLAVLALATLLAACDDDGTSTPTPAERTTAVRTLVLLGTTGADRVLRAGQPVRVTALASDEFGQPVPGVPLVWTASAGSVAADSANTGSNGILGATWTAGTTAGLQEVVATVNGGSGALDRNDVFVYPDTVVGTLQLGPDSASLAVGSSLLLAVTVIRDRYGNPYSLSGTQPDAPPPIEFTSLDPARATLTATTARATTVKALATGAARVVARSDGKADTVTIQVVAPAARR